MLRTLIESLVVSVACILLCSCGSGGGAKLESVTGKVTLNGAPAAGVQICAFARDPARQIPVAPTATSGDDGGFTMVSGGLGTGVYPGEYVVTFVLREGPTDKLNGRYDRQNTPVNFKVETGAVDLGTIDLTPQ